MEKDKYCIKYLIDNSNTKHYDSGGIVYFIYDELSGFTKIGSTKNKIEYRFSDIQKLNPHIVLLFIIEISCHIITEKGLHKTYNNKRIFAEWFKLNKKDFENILERYNKNIKFYKYDDSSVVINY